MCKPRRCEAGEGSRSSDRDANWAATQGLNSKDLRAKLIVIQKAGSDVQLQYLMLIRMFKLHRTPHKFVCYHNACGSNILILPTLQRYTYGSHGLDESFVRSQLVVLNTVNLVRLPIRQEKPSIFHCTDLFHPESILGSCINEESWAHNYNSTAPPLTS